MKDFRAYRDAYLAQNTSTFELAVELDGPDAEGSVALFETGPASVGHHEALPGLTLTGCCTDRGHPE